MLGKKCLFISYNPSLVEFVKKQIDGQDCYSIEGLFSLFATPKEVNQCELDPNGDICYYDRFRTKMLPKYDCIIVDEAQDCTEDWAKTVTLFLKSDGILWIFYDENQNVYKRGLVRICYRYRAVPSYQQYPKYPEYSFLDKRENSNG